MLFKVYDAALTARAVLSAMLCSAREIGTHGAAMVDATPAKDAKTPRKTRTMTRGEISSVEPISEMPSPPLWFETLLSKSIQEKKKREDRA